ncbi:pseudouridine synthase [Coemansia reversa NRRL 1564]|uniref:21S rRNA pseudouridine(2819) synthase n=1 Tax=Coemansia reversa (strain ATCC 12441 / NRRL 1564) TaxID=763665 RepID=A0A2G5B9T6_COERN|nr:pseudouridine synthase [Coemansia reversa NRRL 1564]|eukprot:PIA15750.1 pseudouridine synthase [Coemansia reversa NRRL 1564]
MSLSRSTGNATRIITVSSQSAGLRVDRYIGRELDIPSGLLFKLLRKKAISQIISKDSSNRQRINGSDRVWAGMQLQVPSNLVLLSKTDTKDSTLRNKQQDELDYDQHRRMFIKKKLPVLFENEALAVFQKPFGLACQDGTNVKYSIDTLLRILGKQQSFVYRLVHRLDRNTTGALVVAKSRLAAAALAHAFHERKVSKRYIAVLEGIPATKKGVIDCALLNTGMKTIAVNALNEAKTNGIETQHARSAVTKYKVLNTGLFNGRDISLVEIDIITGRKHQIRAHCSQILGCPVVGDTRYGDSIQDDVSASYRNQMFLHLFRLSIPVSNRLHFISNHYINCKTIYSTHDYKILTNTLSDLHYTCRM